MKHSSFASLFTALAATACISDDVDDVAALPEPEVGETTAALTTLDDQIAQLTGSQLDQKVVAAKWAGYRPISVSAYGGPGAERYAAVFVHRSGPDWKLARGTGHAAFSTTFSSMAAAGYKPTKLSYEGVADNPIWVAVFEQTAGPIPYTRHGLVSGDGSSTSHLQYWIKKAVDEGLMPSTYAIYGSSVSPRYALVLEPNPTKTAWTLGQMTWHWDTQLWTGDGLNDWQALYVARFQAHAAAGARPTAISVQDDGRYLGMFREDAVGSWVTKIDLSHAQLTTEVATQRDAGRIPIVVEGHGGAASPKFAAIFAATDLPLARTFRAIGSGARDPAIPAVDTLFEDFMRANGVRNAGLAVLDRTRLVYARGYNLTEPGTRTVTPTSYFRIASLSKTVTAMEIMKLVEEPAAELSLSTPVQSVLNLTTWDGSAIRPELANITVGQLLRHALVIDDAGQPRCLKRDLELGAEVAAKLGKPLPLSTRDAVRYALAQPDLLRTPPANNNCYSNFGYVLLGMVIEAKRGLPLDYALWNDLLTPSGITRFRKAVPDPTRTEEALYRSPTLSTLASRVTPGAPLAAAPYGENLAAQLASGGMSMAPVDLARLLAVASTKGWSLVFDDLDTADGNAEIALQLADMIANNIGFDGMWAAQGRRASYKGGLVTGLQSALSWDADGLTYVVMFARNGLPGSWFPNWDALITAIRTVDLGNRTDLFPSYGMPAL